MSYNEFNYYKEENKFYENKSIDILSINTKLILTFVTFF